MLKLLLIPIGAAVPVVFFAALSMYYAVPLPAAAILSVLLFLPTVLLPLCDLVKNKKARKYLLRAGEATVNADLYLLIFLLADALLLFFFRIAEIEPPTALLFGVSGGLYALTIVSALLHAKKIKRLHYALTLTGADEEKSLRILVLSDLHFGFFTTRALLRRLARIVDEEKPEIVLIPGDLFDSAFSEFRYEQELRAWLGKRRFRYGIWMCPGNHDAYSEVDPEKEKLLCDCGIHVLSDMWYGLSFLPIAGRRDRKDKHRAPAEAFGGKFDPPFLVMDHQPDDAEKLIDAGAALVLCGHTHNGQTFPGNLLASVLGKYNHGLKRYRNGYVLTTAGAGYWGLPLRLFTSGETALIELTLVKGEKL